MPTGPHGRQPGPEEPVDVPAALRAARRGARTVVVDCVTVWLANLLLADEAFGESDAAHHAQALLAAAREEPAPAGLVIIVTNEVGSGIVPDNALARRFRDCAGRANQVLASGADEVHLIVSGLPLCLKSSKGAAQ
jgi:adenosylcobinamide kinase/adenosylcobinamide-phosphate guanylyltransferase